MRINLQKQVQDFIRESVEIGRYRDASDAVNDGLRLLMERDETEFQRLRNLIKQRMKEARRGESVTFDDELKQGIRKRGKKRLAAMKRVRG